MELRGIDFGCILDASGTEGFFGEGYPYQKALRINFAGVTFVAKTMTYFPRVGNMRIRHDGSLPWWPLKPDYIVIKPFKGVALNAVALSNPGAIALLQQGKWQKRRSPFFLSFMAVGATREERMKELELFIRALQRYMISPHSPPFGLQINSCPNIKIAHQRDEEIIEETVAGLTAASILNIPLMPKFNVLLPVSAAQEISEHPACDAICISNAIPWGALPDRIDWRGLFGSNKSPLKRFGGGSLSGAPLFSLVVEWVENARKSGITKPINAGGGILHPDNVPVLALAGANSVAIGSVAFLRPWRVRPIIEKAYYVYRNDQPLKRRD